MKKVSIEQFRKVIVSNQTQEPVWAALQKLTELKSPREIRGPQPLGIWGVWF